MRNLKMEDLIVLYLLFESETNQYFGLAFDDIAEDYRIDENNMSRAKIYRVLDRLNLIDAVGHYTTDKRFYYYIKNNGLAIIKYIELN